MTQGPEGILLLSVAWEEEGRVKFRRCRVGLGGGPVEAYKKGSAMGTSRSSHEEPRAASYKEWARRRKESRGVGSQREV